MTNRITVAVAQKEYVVREPNPFLFWRPKQAIELLTHDLNTDFVFDIDSVPDDIIKPFAWALEFANSELSKQELALNIVSCLSFVGAKWELSTQRRNIKRVLIVERTP